MVMKMSYYMAMAAAAPYETCFVSQKELEIQKIPDLIHRYYKFC